MTAYLKLVMPCIALLPGVVDASSLKETLLTDFEQYKQSQTLQSLPFILDSTNLGGVLQASVDTLLTGVPYDLFVQNLSQVAEWCEFLPIHLNIKACAYTKDESGTVLRSYVGSKGYMNPDQASLLRLNFIARTEGEVFLIDMSAKSGPYGSSDYQFTISAIEVDGGIFMSFDLSSAPGIASSLVSIYFLTVARKKIGFSVDGKTWSGRTKYVGGQRGAAERNVVRYLLAIKTYFDTLDLPESERFERRIDLWFTATEKYARQLREMDRESYLSIKRRERKNQIILISSLQNNVVPVYEVEVKKDR
ncbi:MAG: hypothetical protein OES26_21545 [Gammaproteobacteria bacterium]|nr:hypothetical protein [Gammaproteobacteria bacterium]